jgi:hypothetical protein
MTQRISVEEYRSRLAAGSKRSRKSKHNNCKVECDGYTFDSKAEMRRYLDLRILQRAGKIRDLVLQPSYSIDTGIYTADFRYVDASGVVHVEDVKGMRTDACNLRLKLMAKLGVLVELVTEQSHPQYWRSHV